MAIGQAVGWLVGWLTATSLLWSTFPPLRNAISAEFSMISTDILCMNILNDAVIATVWTLITQEPNTTNLTCYS